MGKIYLFVHIPRTGGSNFWHNIVGQVNKDFDVLDLYYEASIRGRTEESILVENLYSLRSKERDTFIHLHEPFPFVDYLQYDDFVMTLVRDPLSRYISHFNTAITNYEKLFGRKYFPFNYDICHDFYYLFSLSEEISFDRKITEYMRSYQYASYFQLFFGKIFPKIVCQEGLINEIIQTFDWVCFDQKDLVKILSDRIGVSLLPSSDRVEDRFHSSKKHIVVDEDAPELRAIFANESRFLRQITDFYKSNKRRERTSKLDKGTFISFGYAGVLEAHIKEQKTMIAQRDARVQELTEMVGSRDARVQELTEMVGDRDSYIQELTRMVGVRDERVLELTEMVGSRDARVQELTEMVGDRDSYIQELTRMVGVRDERVLELTEMVGSRDARVQELTQIVTSRDSQIKEFMEMVDARDFRVQEFDGNGRKN